MPTKSHATVRDNPQQKVASPHLEKKAYELLYDADNSPPVFPDIKQYPDENKATDYIKQSHGSTGGRKLAAHLILK